MYELLKDVSDKPWDIESEEESEIRVALIDDLEKN